MSFKYINKVACEIEGGWEKSRHGLHVDQSLKTDQFFNSASIGEAISEPLDTEDELYVYMKNNWPDECPACCGFHIHNSFKHINYYAKCMEEKFFAGFRKCMEDWGKEYPCTNDFFWERLEGKHRFCQKDFRAAKQVKCVNKDQAREKDLRCTQLNYCFGLHRTLENRLLPTFYTIDCAISATKVYLKYIEDYLDKNPVSEKELLMEIVDESEFYQLNKHGEFITQVQNKINLKPFNLFAAKQVNSGLLRDYLSTATGGIIDEVKPFAPLLYSDNKIKSSKFPPIKRIGSKKPPMPIRKPVVRINADGEEQF